MSHVRTPKGDDFLARYASAPDVQTLLETDERVRGVVAKYRAKLPNTEFTDEEIVEWYARYLAKIPRKGSKGAS